MPRRKKLVAPENLAELNTLVAQYGTVQREIDLLKKEADDAKAKIDIALATRTAPLTALRDTAFKRVELYANAHRAELTSEKKKSITLPAGTLRWQPGKPRVSVLKRLKDSDVVAKILKLGKHAEWMLRTTRELNKAGILEREFIPQELKQYLAIRQGEEKFEIKANETPDEALSRDLL